MIFIFWFVRPRKVGFSFHPHHADRVTLTAHFFGTVHWFFARQVFRFRGTGFICDLKAWYGRHIAHHAQGDVGYDP